MTENGPNNNGLTGLRIWLALLALFAVSVFIRLPYLSRPLGWYHEAGTANILVVNKIWDREGGRHNHFAMKVTYGGKANKFVTPNNYEDKDGNYYYLSFPPFAYIAPYLAGKLLGLHPSIWFMKSFGLFLHFLTALGLFLLVQFIITKTSPGFSSKSPAFLAFLIVVFSSGHLWAQGNIYLEQPAVLPGLVFGSLLFLRIISGGPVRTRHFLLFWAVCFLMAYTEWIGFFFGAAVVFYAFFHSREKSARNLAAVAVTACIAAGLLTFWQYASVVGADAFLAGAWKKFLIRSWGHDRLGKTAILDPLGWRNVFYYFWISYGPFLVLILCLGLIRRFIRKKNPVPVKSQFDLSRRPDFFSVAAYLFLFPGILDQFVLFNSANTHDFECLKIGIWFPVLASWLLFRIAEDRERWRGLRKAAVWALIALSMVASTGYYLHLHRKPNDTFKIIGEFIRDNSGSDEIAFLRFKNYPSTLDIINMQVLYYADRNIGDWQGEKKAKELMDLNGAKKYVLFELDVAMKPSGLYVVDRKTYSELVSALGDWT